MLADRVVMLLMLLLLLEVELPRGMVLLHSFRLALISFLYIYASKPFGGSSIHYCGFELPSLRMIHLAKPRVGVGGDFGA